MSVSIVVPFRPDGAERDRNWRWLKSRYETLYPDWEIVEGTCEGPWRKGVAVNAAVEAASGDVLVIADADVLIGEQALRDAVKRLEDSAWVVPHRLVFRLNEEVTKALTEGRLRAEPHPLPQDDLMPGSPRKGPAGGGISVMQREDFVGVDERFIDWGGEDVSFARALDTLVGERRSLGQTMWHLYHEPMPRREGNRASPESEALAAQYLEARGNPVAMRELLDWREYQGCIGGGVVVLPRKTLADVPIDCRFEGWGQEDESFGVALDCLAGQHWRGNADLVHLHHPLAERISTVRGSWEGWGLRRRYMVAARDPAAMSSLIEEALVAREAHQS